MYYVSVMQAINYKKYSTASDVWSFGCVMYEIWSLGHKPFEGYTNSEVRAHIVILKLVKCCVHMLGVGDNCPRITYSMQ